MFLYDLHVPNIHFVPIKDDNGKIFFKYIDMSLCNVCEVIKEVMEIIGKHAEAPFDVLGLKGSLFQLKNHKDHKEFIENIELINKNPNNWAVCSHEEEMKRSIDYEDYEHKEYKEGEIAYKEYIRRRRKNGFIYEWCVMRDKK